MGGIQARRDSDPMRLPKRAYRRSQINGAPKGDSALESLLAFQIKSSDSEVVRSYLRNYQGIPDRKFEFDFAWPSHKVALEVQGGIFRKMGHSTGVGITRDCEKACLGAINGWRLLPVTAQQIRSGQALEWITIVLITAALQPGTASL
jgi:hypothetical protein